jgi:hypothetical protein
VEEEISHGGDAKALEELSLARTDSGQLNDRCGG